MKNNPVVPPQKLADFYNHEIPYFSDLDLRIIKHVKPGGNWQDIPEDVPSERIKKIREISKIRGIARTSYYGRLRPDQPAYTIATYYNRPGNGTNIHPWEHRTISSREAARLQSFPDNFIFWGTEASIRKQIGNAVPPLLGYALGKAIEAETFVDLFAGAGGLSFGLEMAGLRGLVALENDYQAATTFANNHSKSIEVIVDDITKEDVQKKLIQTIKSKLAGKKLGLLVGGPPCQGFSTAGWRNHDDQRNALVTHFLRVVEKVKPINVLIENVEGLLSMKQGDVVKGIQDVLAELGYICYQKPWLVRAEEFGVPQMRKRVIIVATLKNRDLPKYPNTFFDKCYGRLEKTHHREKPKQIYPITVAEAIWDIPNLVDIIDKFLPSFSQVDKTYSQWATGKISTEDFLALRGKAQLIPTPTQLELY